MMLNMHRYSITADDVSWWLVVIVHSSNSTHKT